MIFRSDVPINKYSIVDLALPPGRAALHRLFDVLRLGINRRPRRFVFLRYVHAQVADLVQSQSGELRNLRAHLPEDIFDRVNAVASAERLEQLAQNFPIVARVSGWSYRAIQPLQAAFTVDHRAAFFGEA